MHSASFSLRALRVSAHNGTMAAAWEAHAGLSVPATSSYSRYSDHCIVWVARCSIMCGYVCLLARLVLCRGVALCGIGFLLVGGNHLLGLGLLVHSLMGSRGWRVSPCLPFMTNHLVQPTMQFTPAIWHPNIYQDGKVGLKLKGGRRVEGTSSWCWPSRT